MKELTLKQQADRLAYKAKPAPHRLNIRVPFADKDQAKALGAKWDGTLKTWYIPADADTGKFRKWIREEPT